MDKQTIVQFKKILLTEKENLEQQLKTFAKKDPKFKGDYDTEFPDLGTPQSSDEMAQEVSLYESSLPVEHTLELKLQDIEGALKKIKTGKYGICENCNEEIPIGRLETKPEAKYCISCKAKLTGSKTH
jgi:DnaK suppressor protein